jgi:hypothetical protein
VTDIRITTTGLDQLARRFTGAEAIIGRELVTMVDRLTIAGSTEAKGRVGVKTGTLRSNVPYAKVHNDGRGPVVARGRALRFTIGGQVLFRKRVGPARGRKYMEAGAAVIRRRMPGEVAAAARRITAALAA